MQQITFKPVLNVEEFEGAKFIEVVLEDSKEHGVIDEIKENIIHYRTVGYNRTIRIEDGEFDLGFSGEAKGITIFWPNGFKVELLPSQFTYRDIR